MERSIGNGETRNKIFVVAGMPRSGTTFLYHNLGQHPSIFLPFVKEVDYFSFNYYLGLDWYLGLFREMRADHIGFDISPSYFCDKLAIERIKKFNSDIKVILAIRNPVEFALSWYAHFNTFVWRMPPFEKFIRCFVLKRGAAQLDLDLLNNTVVKILEAYRREFRDNLLFYSFDLFKREPLFVLQAIERFVGLPHYFEEKNFKNIVINAGRRKKIKMFSYVQTLLKWKGAFWVINVPFMRKIVRLARNVVDTISVNSYKGSNIQAFPADHMRIAEEAFADQRDAISEVFAKSKMQLGSGTPFP